MEEQVFKDVNDCRPQVIEHFVGNKQIVKRCKIALEAAWNQGTKLPHILMQGSPGLGKTELSYILGKEMGVELHEQLGQNIRDPKDLHAFLLTPRDRDVVLLDEIHELPPIAQTTLYRAMENQQIFLDTKRGKKSRPVQIANFTILGATTDPQKLLQPLRDRFKIVLDFEFYSTEELEQLLHNRVQQLGWQVEDSVVSLIAQRGKGTPRIVLRLLESVRMTASAENAEVITQEHFHRTCELEKIDSLGLTSHEVRYLRILYENDGSVRLNVIASRLGIHAKHVSQIIEQFLIREGLVTKQNSVRVLTQLGLAHLRSHHLEGGQL
jgi:Holliday junction DNA helicase RuvB